MLRCTKENFRLLELDSIKFQDFDGRDYRKIHGRTLEAPIENMEADAFVRVPDNTLSKDRIVGRSKCGVVFDYLGKSRVKVSNLGQFH